jgi:hypothetical protein
MKSTTFTTQIPLPKGWQPKIKKPKKLGLFSVMLSFFSGGKKKQTCKNCKFNNQQYCTVGTYYAEKGLNKICYEGELWDANEA